MTPRTLQLSNGAPVRVIEAGAGAPVLLLHGVGLRAEAWGPQITALAATHRVIAADLPGHGGSAPLPGTAHLPDFVAWVAAVIAALGLGPVNLAGHSMGALIALGLVVDHPDLVRRVALLNGVHRRSPKARAAVLARAAEIAAGVGGIEAPLARWFKPGEDHLRDQVAGWLATVSPQGYATAYRAFAEGDRIYSERISQIACPLLALTGEDDANSTPEMARTMASMTPQGRAVVVPGQRHMVNLTAAAVVSQALQDWLSTQTVPA